MRINSSPLQALLEIQALDRVPRMGYALRGVAECESVTEHSWHLSFLVWALGPKVPGLRIARALELALIHDVAEVRTGDLPRTAARYLPDGAKKQAERAAACELLAPFGERAASLLAEYEADESLESRFVRGCDKLQLMLKVATYESWGVAGLSEFWDNPENFPDRGIAAIRELFEELGEWRQSRRG